MPPSTAVRPKQSIWDRLRLLLVIITAPGVITTTLLFSPLITKLRGRTWRRTIADTLINHLTYWLPTDTISAGAAAPDDLYRGWAKANNQDPVIDETVEGGQLVWMGPKNAEHVILYFHGGAFLLPIGESMLAFQDYLRKEISRIGGPLPSTALLDYSLAPYSPFPVQMRQAIAALNSITNSGVKPSNIYLIGDSAGGNLILQLASLILHPDPSLPLPPKLSGPLGGAHLISPWINLRSVGRTFDRDEDMISTATLKNWGAQVLKDVPAAQLNYIEASQAEHSWWDGIDNIFSRILVSWGERENLAGDCVEFAKTLTGKHSAVTVLPAKDGVHNEPINDFQPLQDHTKGIAPAVAQWFKDSMIA